MSNSYQEYLDVLEQMRTALEQLSELENQKSDAVRNNDLVALDHVLKQEQAFALTFRGLEQKQTALLDKTGLKGVPLSSLSDSFPEDMRLEAKQTAERLKMQYDLYRSCSDAARTLLECNLHVIDKVIAESSASAEGPGYQPKDPEIPSAMKTDFRA